MHSSRYRDYPTQIFIGYGDSISPDEAQIFTDINQKHRNNVTVIVDQGNNADMIAALNTVTLKRVGGGL